MTYMRYIPTHRLKTMEGNEDCLEETCTIAADNHDRANSSLLLQNEGNNVSLFKKISFSVRELHPSNSYDGSQLMIQ